MMNTWLLKRLGECFSLFRRWFPWRFFHLQPRSRTPPPLRGSCGTMKGGTGLLSRSKHTQGSPGLRPYQTAAPARIRTEALEFCSEMLVST